MVSVCVVPVPRWGQLGQLCPKGVCHNEIVISFSCGGNNSCNCPATNKLCGMLRISRHNFISLPHCSHPPPPLVIVALMCSAVLDLVCALWLCNLWAWGARGCISVAVIIMFFIRFFRFFFFPFLWVKVGVSFECNLNEARRTDCESAWNRIFSISYALFFRILCVAASSEFSHYSSQHSQR